jgi:hypothetical protein
VFLVHNRVESIYSIGNLITRLAPEARVVIAHGQMSEESLERAMVDFVGHKYDVLVEHSIFTGGRGAPGQAGDEAQPPPERFLVLAGIVRQDGDYIAFLEDTKKKAVIKVRAGDAVLDGRISKVALDAVDYAKGDSTVTLKPGQNLEGGQGSPTPQANAAAPGAAAGGGAASQAAPDTPSSSAPANDMVERLKQKRLKELGQ